MRPATAPRERGRTFTETARRAQIVAAAIDTIAEVGYAHASFAEIAKRAGLSTKGLISYHFAGKDELIEMVVTEVYTTMGEFMAERMRAPSSPTAALRTHIQSTVEFIGAHRTQMKALSDIFMNGALHYDIATEQSIVSPIEAILRAGQRRGDFREFDPRVMATVIQRAVDGLPFLMASMPDLDVAAYSAEIVTLFELATRRGE